MSEIELKTEEQLEGKTLVAKSQSDARLKDKKAKPMRRTYQAGIDDPFFGVKQEEGRHYCRVDEHPPSWGLGSQVQKFLSKGYRVDHRVEGTDIYIMSIEQEKFDARKKAAIDLAAARRGGIRNAAGSQVGGEGDLHFHSQHRALTEMELLGRYNG